MGWSRHRLHVLSLVLASASVSAACDGIERDLPGAHWRPIEEIEGVEMTEAPVSAALPTGLRIVSYNVWFGADVEIVGPHFMEHPDLAGADVIAMQENLWGFDESTSDVAQLAGELGMGFVFVPLKPRSFGIEGAAIMSRYPMRDIEVMHLPDRTQDSAWGDEGLAFRVALAATIDTTSGPVRIVNVHLSVPLNIPERIIQIRPALLDLPQPAVVLGDFNTNDYIWVRDSVPLPPLDAAAGTGQADVFDSYMRALGYATPTADFGVTWDGFPEDQRLDAIFTSAELETGDGGVDRSIGFSDHWPVWLDVGRR
jgi:endonuclease/exonuclease/phosphatase family metal-dependent hydrolase